MDRDDRAADARAEEINEREKNRRATELLRGPWDEKRCRVCGWPLATDVMGASYGCVPGNCSMRPQPTTRADAPIDFSSPAAARQLVLALPKERRPALMRELLNMLVSDEHKFSFDDDDDLYALLTATPRQLRDAVLAAMENTNA